jgi:hypothetical protein
LIKLYLLNFIINLNTFNFKEDWPFTDINQLIGCLPLFIAGSVNDRINMDSTIAELMNAGN